MITAEENLKRELLEYSVHMKILKIAKECETIHTRKHQPITAHSQFGKSEKLEDDLEDFPHHV